MEQLLIRHLELLASPWNIPFLLYPKNQENGDYLNTYEWQISAYSPWVLYIKVTSPIAIPWPALNNHRCQRPFFFSIFPYFQVLSHILPSWCTASILKAHEKTSTDYAPTSLTNSPRLCQLFISQGLSPTRQLFGVAYRIHYIDNVLITASFKDVVLHIFSQIKKDLIDHGLSIAPSKVQISCLYLYLGTIVFKRMMRIKILQINMDYLKIWSDFQWLLGNNLDSAIIRDCYLW